MCDVRRSTAAITGGGPPPKPPALGSCSLLGQSDQYGGKSPGQEDKGLGSKAGQAWASLGRCLKTFREALLYAKPCAGKQGPQSRMRPDPCPPVNSKYTDTPVEGCQALALDVKGEDVSGRE